MSSSLAWNISLFPGDEREDHIERIWQMVEADNQEAPTPGLEQGFKQDLRMLVAQKQELFPWTNRHRHDRGNRNPCLAESDRTAAVQAAPGRVCLDFPCRIIPKQNACAPEHTVYTVYMSIHSTFSISQTDGRPMYLQIIEQIRHKVAVGDWPPGAEIPSIRQLAADLSVSVITVKRAYLELEREGVILTQQGRGSIVSHTPSLSTVVWEQQLGRSLDEAARLGSMLGLAPDEIKTRLDTAINQLKET